MAKYYDNASAPIIAFDFDGTINVNGEKSYPECGEVRKYAKGVINLLHEIGINIIIWTSRDVGHNRDMVYDHISPMIEFLKEHNIKYDTINDSSEFAPYHYESRKIYAHLYVDDRAFGWSNKEDIMIDVMRHILSNIVGIGNSHLITYAVRSVISDIPLDKQYLRDLQWYVKNWKKESKEVSHGSYDIH